MSTLQSCAEPLSSAYDVAVLDLDGVVYVGPDAVPGASEALNAAQEGGMHLAFVTNNAARTPAMVGEHLRQLGGDAHDEERPGPCEAHPADDRARVPRCHGDSW